MRARAFTGLVVAVVLTAGVLVAPSAVAAPAPPVAAGSTAGAAWSVAAAGGGAYVVRLTLPGSVPIRDAAPQLAVDGVVLGTARQDPDGRTLRLATTDPRAATPGRVELAWNGVVVGTVTAPAAAPDPAVAAPPPTGAVVPQDPAAATTYRVQRADYDFGDTAVRLRGLGGQAVEERAAVYLPANAPGRRPVVVFLHGRHQPCYGADTPPTPVNPPAWPCPAGQLPVPSHLGYEKAANALAAAGDVVVSISADGINALDFGAADGGAQARGELVLDHLDLLQAWDAGTGPSASPLRGRLDLTRVGLMGHSRGGEGVVSAALLNAERPTPYGIRAVMPLAPVDFGRATLPGVPMAVVLPYCDGDVSDQQGQHFFDDTRYAAGDDVLRTSLLVMGADHNYFNSQWTPGSSTAPGAFDDWGQRNDPVCGTDAPGRLSAAEQRAVGAAYISGFFRLHLNGDRQFLPLFDGTGGRAASAGRAVVHTEAQQPTSSRTDVAPLVRPTATVTTTRGAVFCASLLPPATGQPASCAPDGRNPTFYPHWTPAYLAPQVPTAPMLHLTWDRASDPQAVTAAVAATAVTGTRQALTFRAAPGARARADLTVTVTDRTGRQASTTVAKLSSALDPLPPLTGLGPTSAVKTWLRTVRVPLTAFAGVDVGRLASVTIASAGSSGNVYLSDLAFDTPAPGAGGPSTLPVVSMGESVAFVGGKFARAEALVTLSRPSTLPVTAQIQIGAVDDDGALVPQWVPVTVAPGRTSVRVRFTVTAPGGGGFGGSADHENSLSVPTNAVVGDALGRVQVYA